MNGQRLDAPVDAAIVVLGSEARDGRLAICAGAGVSLAAGLPSGTQLARKIHERFQRVTGYSCSDPENLLAVADAAARLPEGLAALQRVALELAPFDEARPQLAHRLLALLVAENALRLLLTNWDDCVERSWRKSEQIPAARNDVEAEHLRGQFLLKIHGCCTQSDTLLITSDQLHDAPLWTKTYFSAELARSTMVFVGIGDVADYAKQRITELAALVESARVRVVDPALAEDWETSQWRTVLPDLPDARRIAKTADDFLDELAREWIMDLITTIREAPTPRPAPWIDAVTGAFVCFTALQALEWLRLAATGLRVGDSVVQDPGAASALEAIGLLARVDDTTDLREVQFLPSSAVRVGDERLEVMLCPDRQTPADISEAAAERAQRAARRLGPQAELHVLVAAGSVRGPKPRELQADDIIDPDLPVDQLIGGEQQVSIRLTYVDDVLSAA